MAQKFSRLSDFGPYLDNRAPQSETELIFGLDALDKHVYMYVWAILAMVQKFSRLSDFGPYLGNCASWSETELIFGLDALDKHVYMYVWTNFAMA